MANKIGKNENKKFLPYVPASKDLKEFTTRALIIGLVMCVILGAANAYLGLKAGMTIAATYPAAVIGMAILRIMRGTILEENFARTVGSIGESVAAGAIFTIPAFVILKIWNFTSESLLKEYIISAVLMMLGGILGILFVTVLRRVMVGDKTLPFPESVAAAEIHKAGQRGAGAAFTLFKAMILGGIIKLLDGLGLFRSSNEFQIAVGKVKESFVKLGLKGDADKIMGGGITTISAPAATPAYIGVGYIIGPELGALNFAGGVLAWGLLVPLLVFFLGPQMIDKYIISQNGDANTAWSILTNHIYRYIVRPIAVGGMLVGACYTLWRMRKNLLLGFRKGVADLKKSTHVQLKTERTERDIRFKSVALGITAIFVLMIGLYFYFTGILTGALLSAIVMLVAGFFFAAVSGNLVGMIGSSNNPISGLTLATTIVAALTMVLIGVTGVEGVAAVLGVAAVVCVSSAVAGEMLQDLKVGHILGGTPAKMEIGDIIGVVLASLIMFFPLYILHNSDLAANPITGGFGGPNLPAPQAGLMAALSQGIVGGDMAWPLVLVGIVMGFALILIKVKSPMLFAVGMYLPLETTFAIFIGGIVRGIVDKIVAKRHYDEAQKVRVENAGILSASGLIAGEALMGLFIATVVFIRDQIGQKAEFWTISMYESISAFFGTSIHVIQSWMAIPIFIIIILYLIINPIAQAGKRGQKTPPAGAV